MDELSESPILIFASGQRCGSTLLQRFLSSHPHVLIWGEHDGILLQLMTNFDHLYDWQYMFAHQLEVFVDDGYNNFVPNMNPPASYFSQAQRNLISDLWRVPANEMGCPIWGFKEVLYGAEMARRIRQLFPGTRIIHLTRNIFDCFISLLHEERVTPEMQPHVPPHQVWTRARTLDFIETWIHVNDSILNTQELEDSWVYRLTYEHMVQCPEQAMTHLTSWLGLNFSDFDLNVFKHKLYTDRHKGSDPRPKINRTDLSPEEITLLTSPKILRLSEQLNFDMTVA